MRYRTRVAEHLREAQDEGRSRKDIANRLGGVKPNYITMLVRPNYDAVLSMDRLPQLAELRGLDSNEVTRLALCRATDSLQEPIEMNGQTLIWLFGHVCRARDRMRAARARTDLGPEGAKKERCA